MHITIYISIWINITRCGFMFRSSVCFYVLSVHHRHICWICIYRVAQTTEQIRRNWRNTHTSDAEWKKEKYHREYVYFNTRQILCNFLYCIYSYCIIYLSRMFVDLLCVAAPRRRRRLHIIQLKTRIWYALIIRTKRIQLIWYTKIHERICNREIEEKSFC